MALGDYIHLLLVFLPAWILGAERFGLQRARFLSGPLTDVFRALVWSQAWGALSIAIILVAVQVPFNRSLIVLFGLVSTLLLALVKTAQRSWLLRFHGRSVALVLGALAAERTAELEILRGRHVERQEATRSDALRRRLEEGGVDEVVLPGALPPEALVALLQVCDEVGVPALVMTDIADPGLRPPRAEMVGRFLYVRYEPYDPDVPGRFVKAIFDRVFGLLGVLLTLPLIAFVAVLIKLSSPGSVFFVQRRGGLNGRPFPMLKFRTMRAGAESEREQLLPANEMDGPVFKVAEDPRVTAVGRFLRRTSLDELPQLVNVALGHMSLVGPRPLPVEETQGLTGRHRRRLSVKPGLTGLWQVSGRNDLTFERWMELDLWYVENWSLGLDLAIVLRTIPAMISGRGAY